MKHICVIRHFSLARERYQIQWHWYPSQYFRPSEEEEVEGEKKKNLTAARQYQFYGIRAATSQAEESLCWCLMNEPTARKAPLIEKSTPGDCTNIHPRAVLLSCLYISIMSDPQWEHDHNTDIGMRSIRCWISGHITTGTYYWRSEWRKRRTEWMALN